MISMVDLDRLNLMECVLSNIERILLDSLDHNVQETIPK